MDEALAALPLEFENYEKRVETLAILHQYIEGTYTLFPERQKEISIESGNQQLSLFDFIQEEPFGMEKLEEPNLSQPDNEVADTIDVIGTDGEIITAVPQKRNQTKEDTIPQQKEHAEERNNFRITDDALGVGSPKEKFRGNIEAISLLKSWKQKTVWQHRKNRKFYPDMLAGVVFQRHLMTEKKSGVRNIRN